MCKCLNAYVLKNYYLFNYFCHKINFIKPTDYIGILRMFLLQSMYFIITIIYVKFVIKIKLIYIITRIVI